MQSILLTVYSEKLHIKRRDFIMKHVSPSETHNTHMSRVNINMTSCQSPSRGNSADQQSFHTKYSLLALAPHSRQMHTDLLQTDVYMTAIISNLML